MLRMNLVPHLNRVAYSDSRPGHVTWRGDENIIQRYFITHGHALIKRQSLSYSTSTADFPESAVQDFVHLQLRIPYSVTERAIARGAGCVQGNTPPRSQAKPGESALTENDCSLTMD